ncbi:MAG TPA: aminotransferase class V-fold PLP-dependent enzyme [Promicromonospora sp.]|nr:aminotransferase class V-fold PLP-dependent enzyme [Promicromonospora sp.]
MPADLRERAAALDAADPLAHHRDRFARSEGLVAYLDGNSLGRPLAATRERLASFVDGPWAGRLIRSWDEGWMDAPTELGDTLGRVALGAAPGQTVVADSTTVLLYKAARAALEARPGRRVIVADTENFPTDRFVLEGIAAERGLELRWITPDPEAGVTPEEVAAAVGPDTALVLLSHIAYKSAYVADLPGITRLVHDAGALVLWDLCHSAGAVPLSLDADGVDLAVGCTYKYLNGGPGSPAFAYVATGLQDRVRQPVQGWMGSADPFAMGPAYEPASGIRQMISGTPPIVGMLPMRDMLDLLDEAGMPEVRAKSTALTGFVIDVADAYLPGVRVVSPRDPERRGSHVMLDHPDFRRVVAQAWERGVVPDFRPPQGLRVGLSPLSTSFTEVAVGLWVIRELLG